jgi:hypothetical protein
MRFEIYLSYVFYVFVIGTQAGVEAGKKRRADGKSKDKDSEREIVSEQAYIFTLYISINPGRRIFSNYI